MKPVAHALIVLCLAVSGLAGAAPETPKEPSVSEIVLSALPAALGRITPGHSTEADVLKALGKPAEKTRDAWRYDLGGGKYDTTIQFRSGRVAAIHYRLAPGKLDFASLESAGLRGSDAGDPAVRARDLHRMGMEREALYAAEGIRLRYRTGSSRPVVAVVLLPPGKSR